MKTIYVCVDWTKDTKQVKLFHTGVDCTKQVEITLVWEITKKMIESLKRNSPENWDRHNQDRKQDLFKN